MKNESHRVFDLKTLAVFGLLVGIGTLVRVYFQHIPNFAPVAAIAMFAGYFFRSKLVAVCVPLSVMLISDQLVDAGGYPWLLMLSVYACLALPVLGATFLRRTFRQQHTVTSGFVIGGMSIGCSLLFFVCTNAMVWATTTLYPPTLTGLATCYAAAIPFFQYTLAGDLIFSTVLFGSLATWKMMATTPQHDLATSA